MSEANLFPGRDAHASVISVSTLTRLAREQLEQTFPLCWVAGEISNLTFAASGHVYFSLKDASSQVRCVMFRNKAQLLGWRPENGQKVEARVLVTLYEARGDFQLMVEMMRRSGVGNLYEQFIRLKERLEREGLFDPAIKRALPAYPRTVGIVTSPQAAALQDVLTTLRRRAPNLRVILYPTPVQGDGAGARVAEALRAANDHAQCDVVILCRGGGSIEDLWAFNEEIVARALRASHIPVICGVGHETDVTIADYAADRRAPTPTAAAEMAAPDRRAQIDMLNNREMAINRLFVRQLRDREQRLDWLATRLLSPGERLRRSREQLDLLERRITHALFHSVQRRRDRLSALTQQLAFRRPNPDRPRQRLSELERRMRTTLQYQIDHHEARLLRLATSLAHLDPESILTRGYSIVRDHAGQIVHDARQLEPNDAVSVLFASGRAEATITSVTPDK